MISVDDELIFIDDGTGAVAVPAREDAWGG